MGTQSDPPALATVSERRTVTMPSARAEQRACTHPGDLSVMSLGHNSWRRAAVNWRRMKWLCRGGQGVRFKPRFFAKKDQICFCEDKRQTRRPLAVELASVTSHAMNRHQKAGSFKRTSRGR